MSAEVKSFYGARMGMEHTSNHPTARRVDNSVRSALLGAISTRKKVQGTKNISESAVKPSNFQGRVIATAPQDTHHASALHQFRRKKRNVEDVAPRMFQAHDCVYRPVSPGSRMERATCSATCKGLVRR